MTDRIPRRRRIWSWPDALVQDLRCAARTLRNRPGFAAVIVSIVALGVGVNVAVFSLVEQILLRPLPVASPNELVDLTDPGPEPDSVILFGSLSGGAESIFSYPMFRDLEREQKSFAGIAAHRLFVAHVSTGESARRESGFFVSGGYFSTLGLKPALGRLLGPEDNRVDGQAHSVVLSYAYWQRELGAAPDVVGQTLHVNGTPLTIVGVAPRGFRGITLGVRASVFVPMTFPGPAPFSVPNHDNRNFYWAYIFARLKPGITREEAASAINPLYRSILAERDVPLLTDASAKELQAFRTKSLVLESGARGQSLVLAPVKGRLELLVAISVAVLLLCCANVAGLMLVRSFARTGEVAVRTAIGASRARIASLVLAEALLLAIPAAVASLLVATLTLRGIASGFPGLPATTFDPDLDSGAWLIAIGVAVIASVAFGLLPAFGLIRTAPGETLQANGVRQTSSKHVTRFRTVLATAQIALSMALLTVTAVFAQSLTNIERIDLGIDVGSVVTFSISPGSSGYSPEATVGLFDRLRQALGSIPGVASVGSATVPILAGASLNAPVTLGSAKAPALVNYVGPGFFRTLGISLLSGRPFESSDAPGAPAVAVVNQRFAERFGLGRDVIGRRATMLNTDAEIVGLAADAKYDAVTHEIGPQMFLPLAQSNPSAATFYVRGTRPAKTLLNDVRATVSRVEPSIPIVGLRTMREQVDANLGTQRYAAGASVAFSVLATVLAGLGLYGLLAYSVAQRSREIGLRFALGAPASRVRRMVLRQVAAMTLLGIALGAPVAFLLGRLARSLLFGVGSGDPIAFVAAAVVVAAVTLGAAYIPARRASRVDPMTVLRYE